ncbi:MAG: hypothetical protein IT416_01970 [Candidatus Pacebacteria bacterium]|nr:hypothetical protein [Candidatus Paceibacterota bacterium]
MINDENDVNKYKGKPCAWCGDKYYDRAHVPTKFLIPKSERNRPNLPWPILPSCKKCNAGLKLDEEWFAVHFASALSEFSAEANKVFSGPITKHLTKKPAIAKRYMKYLDLVELKIMGVSQGLKTRINMSQDDWNRLENVADMFARGLYYWHTGINASKLKSKIVYLVPKRFENFSKYLKYLIPVELFPGKFEYAYGVTETNEAVFIIAIYGKPSYLIHLVSEERFNIMENKVKSGEIKPNKVPGIEILG